MKTAIRVLTSALLAAALLLTGCGGTVEEYSEPELSNPFASTQSFPDSSAASSAVSSEQHSAGLDYTSTGIMNRLTGQTNLTDSMKNKRPVAVVVNNYVKALPQNGISQADLVVEMDAGGGITRLLALYSDWKDAPTIGSVREARLYFLDMAQSFDAIMVHITGTEDEASSETLNASKTRGYQTLNAYYIADLTYRDETLKLTRAWEHTALTDGARITSAISSRSIREEYADSAAATCFKFSTGEIIEPEQFKARSIFLPVGNSAEYRYDSASGLYKRYEAGTAQTDLNDGTQVAVTNVLTLFAAQTTDAESGKVSIALNAGEGYYFTMGRGQKIYWQRDGDVGGRIVLYDASGSELTLNQGRSWINIISDQTAAKVTWTEIGA